MPIRINLLAEAQAAEELRRKDPVKRAILLGAAVVAIMVMASIFFQSQVMATNHKAENFNGRIQAITNKYAAVMADSDRLQELHLHIRGLDILASERFLNGSLLNSLQKAPVENVQMIHLRVDQTYNFVDETKSKPIEGKPGPLKVLKPATANEKVTLVVEARDVGPNPGDQVTKFKDALAKTDYITKLLGTNTQLRLVNRSPPQLQSDSGRLGVQFTLEARLPEKARLDITSPVRYAAPQAAPTAPRKAGGPEEISL